MVDRYDGPDVEGELAGRIGGHGMTAVMVAEGVLAGLAARGEQAVAAAAEATRVGGEHAAAELEAARVRDRARWSAVTTDPGALTGWDGEQLGLAWVAAVRWPDEGPADRARAAVESEMMAREPQAMTRYAGLRACGHEPGEAMRRALVDHHNTLVQDMAPLLGDRAGLVALDDGQLWRAWSAAQVCPTPQAATARTAAAGEAARRGGALWQEYQRLAGGGPGHGYGNPVADAAAAGGHPFHPGHLGTPTWLAVATHGVPVATTPTPTVTIPAAPRGQRGSVPGRSVAVRVAALIGRPR